MITVHFLPEFMLAAANMELDRASKATNELLRLMNVGYFISQTGLDVAKVAKTHLMKAHEILAMINIPDVKVLQRKVADSLAEQNMIIENIEKYI